MEAVQTTPFQSQQPLIKIPGLTNAPRILHLEQVKLSGTLGGKVEVDGAAFATTGDLTGFDPGIQLRRLRLRAGGDCVVLLPVSYLIELGYSGGQFTLTKAYLDFPDIRYIGDLVVGQFQPPMGLQLITSSRDISFMEPAAPLQAMAPSEEAGVAIGRPVFDNRATWWLGLFAPGAGATEYGNASQDYGSLIGRVTGLPIYDVDSEHPNDARLLHLGMSANLLYSGNSTVRYKSRPESYIAPTVIDTGDIDASSALTLGTEAAWVHGPWNAQGEFIYSLVNQESGSHLGFFGFYGQLGWFLTGESRPYDTKKAAFKRLVPIRDFDFGKSGWGAFELVCRYSYTDLTDANVDGGRLNLMMAGVNWYLQPHIRWMFNYGMGRVTGGAEDGRLFIFQTRVGVDF
jgi:phosphate-selective porin OprO/OprP